VAGFLVWQVVDQDEYIAPTPRDRHAEADPTAADAALRDLARRIRTGRTAGAGQVVADTVRNARALRVEGFSATYVAESGAVTEEGRWPGTVDVRWRLAGFDRRTASSEVTVAFARDPDGDVRITGFGGSDARLPVWLSGPLQVRRAAGVLVAVRGNAATAGDYLRIARTAVADVREVHGWRDPRLVIEVPSGQDGLEAALDADPGSYGGVAAVTATVDGSSSPQAPVHVFVNPAVIGSLNGRGAQVVLSHEATHVATGVATNASMPLWLLEGFADYVALRDVGLPLSTTAGQILKAVRRDGPPPHLPGRAEFDQQSSQFGREYEAAWLACRVFAEEAGEKALVRLYDRVNDGAPLDAAMRQVSGFGVAELTRRWQDRLSDWAA